MMGTQAAEAKIDVNVPIDVAYDQWTKFESYPQLLNGPESVRRLDDQQMRWEMNLPGAPRQVNMIVTEQVLNDHIRFVADGGNFDSLISFESIDDGHTEVKVSVANGGPVDDAHLSEDLERFKRLIEG